MPIEAVKEAEDEKLTDGESVTDDEISGESKAKLLSCV